MATYKRVMDAIVNGEKVLVGVILLFEVVLTAGNVFSRYVIHKSWSFTEEIVVALLVLLSLMGAAICAREKGGLISFSYLTDKLGKRAQKIVDIIIYALLVYYGCVLIVYGWDRCLTQIATNRTTAALKIPEWYYSAFIPFGCGLIVLHSIEYIVDRIAELLHLAKPAEEVGE